MSLRAGHPPERQLLHARARRRDVEIAPGIGRDMVAGAQDALGADRSEDLERRAVDDDDAVIAPDVEELLLRVRGQGTDCARRVRRS